MTQKYNIEILKQRNERVMQRVAFSFFTCAIWSYLALFPSSIPFQASLTALPISPIPDPSGRAALIVFISYLRKNSNADLALSGLLLMAPNLRMIVEGCTVKFDKQEFVVMRKIRFYCWEAGRYSSER